MKLLDELLNCAVAAMMIGFLMVVFLLVSIADFFGCIQSLPYTRLGDVRKRRK